VLRSPTVGTFPPQNRGIATTPTLHTAGSCFASKPQAANAAAPPDIQSTLGMSLASRKAIASAFREFASAPIADGLLRQLNHPTRLRHESRVDHVAFKDDHTDALVLGCGVCVDERFGAVDLLGRR